MKSKLVFASVYTLGLLFLALGFLISLIMYVYGFFDIGYAIVLIILFNFAVWLLNPYITDLIHKWLFKMKFVSREELLTLHPEVEAFIAKVTQEKKIRFPKMGLIEDENPTAYTYGSAAFNARMILTKGLFTYLQSDEVEAVVAHELGHIVHRDFIVMAVANTVIQIFYLVYRWFIGKRSAANTKGGNGKSGNGKAIIAVVAYIFYIVGFYIVLYLNRVRESYADEFSAQVTGKPASLSHALIKIGYGIMAKEDSAASTELMGQTQTLGIMGIASAKSAGLIAKVTNMEPEKISKVLVYDFVSPWAKLGELASTHPLIGKRLAALDVLAKKIGQPSLFDVDKAIVEANVDKQKLWRGFTIGAIVHFLPIISLIFGSVFLFISGYPVGLGILLWWLGVAVLIKTLYRFPKISGASTKSIYELMIDPYASPAMGVPVKVEGSVVGKGVPGYAFSEDIMLQDNTGLIYLDYQAGIPLIGNILFAWKKVQQLLGKPASANGWFFRSSFHYVTLADLKVDQQTFKSYAKFWNIVLCVIIFVLAWVVGVAGLGILASLWLPILIVIGVGYYFLQKRNAMVKPVDPEIAKQQQLSGKRVLKGVLIGVLILVIGIFMLIVLGGGS